VCVWKGNIETLLIYCLCTSTALVVCKLQCAYDRGTLKHFLFTVYVLQQHLSYLHYSVHMIGEHWNTSYLLFMYFNCTCHIYIAVCIWYGNIETLLINCLCASTALVISTLQCAYDTASLKHFLCTVFVLQQHLSYLNYSVYKIRQYWNTSYVLFMYFNSTCHI
jgi:hypothetical protein